MDKKDFIERTTKLGSLTPAEQLIIDYFHNNFSMLPYAKVDPLCQQIGIGKATLGRFLNRLGFRGFMDFKK